MNGVKAFADTNVLVYVFDAAEPQKRQAAARLVEPGDLVISAQVLSEFYWTITRELASPVAAEEASRIVAEYARLEMIPITASLVQAAIRTSQDHQLAYWDALILEAAVAGGCSELLTEDLADGLVLRGVRIRNPFA
jgi:predicted nucleic acid-binding protein